MHGNRTGRTTRTFLLACQLSCCLVAHTTSFAAEPTGLAALSVPPGFTVELVAGPPLIERPMLAAFDDRGRLYVCDSAGVNLRGPELAENPPHSIRCLEDTDGDGRFDKSSVFADKMLFPQGIVWHAGSVYCSSPPSFWKLTDTDNDGKADQREELVTGFANTGVADDMHGGSLGPDGRLYWCAGRFPHAIQRPGGPIIHQGTAPLILRCRPDGSELEVVCGSQGNAVGVAFTSAGDMFASGTFLAPNSMGAGLRDALIHCVDGGEYPVRDRVLNEHKRTGELLPPLTHLGVSASSDLVLCQGDALGADAAGDLFSALFNMHKIVRHRLTPLSASYQCRNEDFLVSSDADFHPTDVLQDADGSLLVVDTGGWFRIGCPTSQVAKPEVLGAIYRVRHTGATRVEDPRGLKLDWQIATAEELAARLADVRPAVRERAMHRLSEKPAESLPALAGVLKQSTNVEARCAAVWSLSRHTAEQAAAVGVLLNTALDDVHPDVRQAAARAAGISRIVSTRDKLQQHVISDTPPVRREAATALGRLKDKAAVPGLLGALESVTNDRFLEHAILFALIELADSQQTLVGLADSRQQIKRGALIALDQMDGYQLEPAQVLSLLDGSQSPLEQTALWIIGRHPDWGGLMTGYFADWLARPNTSEAQQQQVRQHLLAFAGDEKVQSLIAEKLRDKQTPPAARLLLAQSIAASGLARVPDAWTEALGRALADSDERLVAEAVAAARVLPLAARPIASKVVPQVNFEETRGGIVQNKLKDSFSIRFNGFVRCPTEGTYTFAVNSDDGSRLYLDGKLLVDNGGSHAARQFTDTITLPAGEHPLRLDYVEQEGEAVCILSWALGDEPLRPIPAEALWHRPAKAALGAELHPGLLADVYRLAGESEGFPDPAASVLDAPLTNLALDARRPIELRTQAAAAVAPRLSTVDKPLFEFLRASLDEQHPPLVRLDAADALAHARLDGAQLRRLCDVVAGAGVLEVPKLLAAFEQSGDEALGQQLLASLRRSPGAKNVSAAALSAVLAGYPDSVRQAAEPLLKELSRDRAAQQAKLASLADVLTGGEIQRGRDLFYGNQKAICATCHAVNSQGGKIGPDLTKIGAIRTPRDLLEAIVIPSASFARGYEPVTLVTDAGQIHAGVIARETADAVYLFNNARAEIRVPRTSIESLAQGTVSIMPEGMDAQLSRQDLADLIAFLASLR